MVFRSYYRRESSLGLKIKNSERKTERRVQLFLKIQRNTIIITIVSSIPRTSRKPPEIRNSNIGSFAQKKNQRNSNIGSFARKETQRIAKETEQGILLQ